MSREEARRRLQAADPHLTIISGRRSSGTLTRLPKLLSDTEAEWWGLPVMLPDFPEEEILHIEAKWSKKDLQRMADENYLDPRGDKELLVSKLIYVGVLDSAGRYIEPEEREREPVGSPTVSFYAKVDGNPIKRFCCRLCGTCAPAELLQEGRFLDRINWLRRHYQEAHPGMWGKGKRD